jgi:putative Holliday junction resolvase
MSRVIALDHGEARCGVAVSDPTGELVTPLPVIERPDSRRGLQRVANVIREREATTVVVGLPLTLAGVEGTQAEAARTFAERLDAVVDARVELHDERLTTKMADRTGGSADSDSVAAAHLLESWLQARKAKATDPEAGVA